MEELQLIRPLEEQFNAAKCAEIRRLIAKFSTLSFEGGPCRYFVLEVAGCLKAGLLLAAVSIASVLLETFLRELLILHRLQTRELTTSRQIDTNSLFDKLEKEIEDGRPRLYFEDVVDQLTGDVLDSGDAVDAKKFYKTVRIPIHHGITRRFIALAKTGEVGWFDTYRGFRLHHLEELIEEDATKYLGFIVNLIQKYTK